MRSLWILVVLVLAVAALIGCQVASNLSNALGGSDAVSGIAGLTLNITQPMDESVVRSNPLTVTGNTIEGVDVMINGLSVGVKDGRFVASVELEPGPNTIDVSARDPSGKEASKYLTVVYVP